MSFSYVGGMLRARPSGCGPELDLCVLDQSKKIKIKNKKLNSEKKWKSVSVLNLNLPSLAACCKTGSGGEAHRENWVEHVFL